MDRQVELSIDRTAYAKQILAAARVNDARLLAALSETRREDFLGPGPWPVFRGLREYVMTPDADPVYLYTDDLVGILPQQRINNGQPSLHAHLIHHASPAVGDRIVHIGTGAGYYTAIFAHLAGPSGRVTGFEYDSTLAHWSKPAAHRDILVGSHSDNSGQAITIARTTNMIRWKGMVPNTTSASLPSQMLWMTNRLMPIGGEICPSST